MKQGKIVSVSHSIPDSSPLKTYKDFHQLWLEQVHKIYFKSVKIMFDNGIWLQYGYCLPCPPENDSDPSPGGPYVTVKYPTSAFRPGIPPTVSIFNFF